MDRRVWYALLVAALLVAATAATGSRWPFVLLVWGPLVAIGVLTVGVWVARKLRI